MTTNLNFPAFRLRDFRWDDIPALVAIGNLINPDEPGTVEQYEHWERTYPADNPRLRFTVESADGQVLGSGVCLRPYWGNIPGAYIIWADVHPAWRRRGVGQALFAALEMFGWAQGAARLRSDCREDFADSIRFFQRAGYGPSGMRFESRLDLTAFDEGRFGGAFERVQAAGYTITTLAAERGVRADAERRLFELYNQAMADVPLPGGAQIEATYENFIAELASPTADPAGAFIALHGGEYVGLTTLELLQDGPAITASTGVLRQHRGGGLALALKLASFRFLQERGYRETRAHNDTANPAILHLNRRLGYTPLPGWLEWEKLRPAA